MEAWLAVLVAAGHEVDEWRTPRAPRLDGGGAEEGAHGASVPSLAAAPFLAPERQHHLCRAMAASQINGGEMRRIWMEKKIKI
jgi:hypothetical protein